jgi:hypothetical protein
MRKRFFGLTLSTLLFALSLLGALLFALSFSASAQQPKKFWRIGIYRTSTRLEIHGPKRFGWLRQFNPHRGIPPGAA